ncbi:hypothetical protein QR680_007735 [Steinernema hermaphroditum]|uniref:Reverse transcriptase domain-containing protein n=1 Tax=Steinernema hermaphroditum TaxID=289476 RepID=A0AA39IE38_9BILA|nr:hypothetical protein QR680_007735 [Steinernema hermaphroditum]
MQTLTLLNMGVQTLTLLNMGVQTPTLLNMGVQTPTLLNMGVQTLTLLNMGVQTLTLLNMGVQTLTLLNMGVQTPTLLNMGVQTPTLLNMGVQTLTLLNMGVQTPTLLNMGVQTLTLLNMGVQTLTLLNMGARAQEGLGFDSEADVDDLWAKRRVEEELEFELQALREVDHLHAINELLEKTREYRTSLFVAFVDFEKAFDSVEVNAVWKAAVRQGVPVQIVNLLQNIYSQASSHIRLGEERVPINIQRGVRQGDTISPKLFTAVLAEVFRELDWTELGVKISGQKGLQLAEVSYHYGPPPLGSLLLELLMRC